MKVVVCNKAGLNYSGYNRWCTNVLTVILNTFPNYWKNAHTSSFFAVIHKSKQSITGNPSITFMKLNKSETKPKKKQLRFDPDQIGGCRGTVNIGGGVEICGKKSAPKRSYGMTPPPIPDAETGVHYCRCNKPGKKKKLPTRKLWLMLPSRPEIALIPNLRKR